MNISEFQERLPEKVEYIVVKDPKMLTILEGQSASFKDLHFSFSKKYIYALSQLLSEKNAIQLLVMEDGEFAGYISAAETLRQYKNYIVITELFISPDFQGKGYGKKTVEQIKIRAQAADLKGMIVQTEFENIPAQKLYEKQGFQKIINKEWMEGVTYQYKF
ncbi:hypothetical protein COB57_00205 [Candidatus Peregrinibacteria bacterium]|nr:MAG: hypothetical protein COB57_00205 [Candidatus Peregrinibacteria bacterium]